MASNYKTMQVRLAHEMLEHLERVQDEFALPSRNAALAYVIKRDMKVHPSKGRVPADK